MTESFELTSDIAVPLLLASEILPILLIVFRKWSNNHAMSINPFDWLLAFVGANTPLLAVAGDHGHVIPQELCSLVILTGLMVQISAKLVLWRSFGIVAAVREVKVSGPYRIVRHPMYAGYTIVHMGFLLAFPSLWNLCIYSAALLVQIARLLREEQLLKTDPAYRAFATRVRYRLLPGVF
jgi:protein-S-isoprenylcysteine O-methyltransferase Ste14